MKRVCLFILAATLLFGSDVALAQVGCPPGYFPIVQGQTGQEVQTCVPEGDAGYGGGSAAAPVKQWEDRWGAIASDGNGNYGIVTDVANKRQAKKLAVDECLRRGGVACEAKLEFVNQCAAVISGNSTTAIAHGATEEVAIALGTRRCNRDGDSDCHVYYSGCSLPVKAR